VQKLSKKLSVYTEHLTYRLPTPSSQISLDVLSKRVPRCGLTTEQHRATVGISADSFASGGLR
jgi:hypothetical protein